MEEHLVERQQEVRVECSLGGQAVGEIVEERMLLSAQNLRA